MLFQVRQGKVVTTGSDAQFAAARAEFRDHRLVRLPGFLSPETLAQVRLGIDASGYLETGPEMTGKPAGPQLGVYQGTNLAHDLRSGPTSRLFDEIVVDQELLRGFERITGVPTLAPGKGRIFRILPSGVDLPWHDDTEQNRVLDLAVGLTWEPVSGGHFQMRDPRTEAIFNDIPPLRPGDAILIQLSRDIEHHFAAVRGTVPLTIHSGKFAPLAA